MIIKAYFSGQYLADRDLLGYSFLVMKAGETDGGEIIHETAEVLAGQKLASQIRGEYIGLGRCLLWIWSEIPAGITRLDVFGSAMCAICEVNGVWLCDPTTETLRDRCREIMLEIAIKSGRNDYPRLAYVEPAENGLADDLLTKAIAGYK